MKQPQMTDALRRNELCVESRGVIMPREKNNYFINLKLFHYVSNPIRR